MAMAQVQRQSFEDRLARINKGGDNTMGAVQIGPRDEESARTGKAKNTVRVKAKRKKNVRVGEGSNLVLVTVAFLIGGFSVFVGKAATFHFFTEGGLMPLTVPVEALVPYAPYAYLLIGGLLALAFAWSFALNGLLRKMAVALGFAAMLYGEAQVVEQFPKTYANFFSKAYVAEVLGRSV